MTDHPALIRTSRGPIGVNVSVPDAPLLASAVFLEGGDGRRFGPNSLWTLIARDLAGLGVAVLRVDFPGAGDSMMARGDPRSDRDFLAETLQWFRIRTGPSPLLVIGSCLGARLACNIADREQDVDGVALIVPFLRATPGPVRRSLQRHGRLIGVRPGIRFDPHAIDALARVLTRTQVAVVIGEKDVSRGDLTPIGSRLGEGATRMRITVVDGVKLHFHQTRRAQEATRAWTSAWAQERLGDRART
ncbi:MAG TPA: alpha/beta fold hydrolase [Actinomycetota bacterium]|nr:alpha/beta fold hydrolase [Actinomycetota bacterium]